MYRLGLTSRIVLAVAACLMVMSLDFNARAESKGSVLVQDVASKYRIRAIRGRLFKEHNNELETEDIVAGERSPWNVIITSNVLVIFVDVEGPAVGASSPGTVDLVIRTKAGVIYSKTLPLRKFFTHRNEILTIPFVVHETGCVPMSIVASLRGTSGPPNSMSATIPFACGE